MQAMNKEKRLTEQNMWERREKRGRESGRNSSVHCCSKMFTKMLSQPEMTKEALFGMN